MRVADITSRTVKTYIVTLEDGEVRDQRHSRQGRQYRVARVEVIKRDGNVSGITLSGPVIKKDGTDSQLAADERLYGEREWPTWLRPIVGGLA